MAVVRDNKAESVSDINSGFPVHATPAQVTIVIPVLNEAANIGILLQRLNELYPGLSILVVDDNSTDGTDAVVKLHKSSCSQISVHLLERRDAQLRGITVSVLDALSCVATPYVGVMDGDLQHPPEVLGQLMESMTEGIDLSLAARLPYKENQGLHRIVVTRVATWFARRTLVNKGYRITDPMSGLFLVRTSLFKDVVTQSQDAFEPKGYKVLYDLLTHLPQGVQYTETHYQFALREAGSSKLKPRHAFYFLRSLLFR